jgi:DNA-binding NarL/FixJ family response regulator
MISVRGEDELLARAGHLFAARDEFVCAATTMSTWANTHRGERIKGHLSAGVDVRKLYNPTAVADPEDAARLTRFVAHGARVRICPTPLPHETIIVDRKVAFLAGPRVDGVRRYTVLMSPDAVAGVRSLFMATWAGSRDLADHLLPAAPPPVDEQGLALLRLLSSGQKDETAARSMGVSVRTYRRRVAELMTLLGAESRFQAGERARALGLRW